MNPIDPNVPVLPLDVMRHTINQLNDPNEIINTCGSLPAYVCNDIFWLNTIVRIFHIAPVDVTKYNDPVTGYRAYFNTLVQAQTTFNSPLLPNLIRNIYMNIGGLDLARSYQLLGADVFLNNTFWINKTMQDAGMTIVQVNANRAALGLSYREYYYHLAGLPL